MGMRLMAICLTPEHRDAQICCICLFEDAATSPWNVGIVGLQLKSSDRANQPLWDGSSFLNPQFAPPRQKRDPWQLRRLHRNGQHAKEIEANALNLPEPDN